MTQKKLLIIVSITALLLTAGGYFAYSTHQQRLQQQEIKTAQDTAQKIEAEKADVKHDFDILLNMFLDDLSKKAGTYAKQRIILKETIYPVNFEKPEFAPENYKIFTNDIMPMLRKTTDDIISTFDTFDKKAQEKFKSMPPEVKKELLPDWIALQKEQLNNFVTFFAREEEIIRAYQAMLKFYAQNSASFTYNRELDALEFDSLETAQKEKELYDVIIKLQTRDEKSP